MSRGPSWLARCGWLLLALPLFFVALSIGRSPQANGAVFALALGFAVLAIVRADVAVLTTTAFVAFGSILSVLCGAPAVRVAELLVMLALGGGCLAAARRPQDFQRALRGWLFVPATLLGATAIASTMVWLRVDQFQTGYAGTYLEGVLRFFTHDYFTAPGNFWGVVSTAVIVEGLALFVLVTALCRIDATFFPRALRMLAIGGAAIGTLSVVRFAEILLRNPDALATFRATSIGLRISPQIPDYIAAGSYFSLCWIVSLGLSAAESGRARIGWLAAGLPLIAALYLTGSRSVIAAALAGLLFLGLAAVRRRAGAARGILVFAVLVLVAMIASYKQFTGRDAAGEMAKQSVTVRIELIKAGLDVIATRPVFGVGIDRFFLIAAGFASPTLRELWTGRMNPHNDFLRFAGELGLVGLLLFLWILGLAAIRIWNRLRGTPDVRLVGVAGGVVAFLVTSCVSNPLMVREVSYVFWIALGLAVGGASSAIASEGAVTTDVEARHGRRARLPRLAGALAAGALAFSIPSRADVEISGIHVTRLAYGFYEWGQDADGTPSRWSGPRATLFVDAHARAVDIPLSGAAPGGASQQVEIRLDGRVANRIAVGTDRQNVRIALPPTRSIVPRRIDLTVTPTWVPARLIPGNQDHRELGVKVGELKVTM